MNQIYNDNTKRPKPKENQLGILGISSREFTHYVGNSAEGLQSRTECCWGYVSIFENTPKKLLHLFPKSCATLLSVQGKAQLVHSSHIVNVGVEAT